MTNAAPVAADPTTRLLCGRPDEEFALALVLKRTFDIRPDGRCTLADEQEPVFDDAEPYDPGAQAPLNSPPRQDNDCFPFKLATDLVVQGDAHAYGRPEREVMVEVRIRGLRRQIRVHGDRTVEWTSSGPVFTKAEPFETMPVRYERAYGGFDAHALRRERDPLADAFASVRPEWNLDAMTSFHYPRNRAGVGYLMRADRESVQGLRAPNLEFPADPVTPDRLAVGAPDAWMNAPLPASFDWCDQSWFPRIAYLGLIPPHDAATRPPREITLGLALPDLLDSPSIFDLKLRHEFTQGASAGLIVPNVAPDEPMQILNMFPESPEQAFRLPGVTPTVWIEQASKKPARARTRLLSIIVRPGQRRLVLVWSAVLSTHRMHTPDQLQQTPCRVEWRG